MKICIFVDDYLPASRKVAGKMMHEIAGEMRSRGHDVTAVVPESNLIDPFKVEMLDSIRVVRFRSGVIKNVSKTRRAINETLLGFNAWRSCRKFFLENPHDLILYYSPSIFWGNLVRKLKKLWGVPSYLILRDFYPQMFFDEGLINEKSPIGYYFKFFEWVNYRAADTIGIESPKNLEWFKKKFKSVEASVELLYNWAADAPGSSPTGHYRRSLGLEGKVIFFYGGNIGPQQDIMNIVRLAKAMVNESNAHFVLVGEGFALSLLRETLEAEKLENVTLLAPVSQEDFKNMLSEFDIGLFSLNYDHTTHNIPGKLLGYMVHGKPILGSINPNNDLEEILESAKAGLISINGDDRAFVENALRLLNDPDLRGEMGLNAKKLLSDSFSVWRAADTIMSSASSSFQRDDSISKN